MRRDHTPAGPIYLYLLRDPRTNGVRYIGQTINQTRRFTAHLAAAAANAKKGKTTEKDLWIQELRALGLRPRMEMIAKIPTEDEASDEERRLIEHYTAEGAALFNAPSRPPREPLQAILVERTVRTRLRAYAELHRITMITLAGNIFDDWLV